MSVPIGFIYTQFTNQSDPTSIWPGAKWKDVTKQYSGLFFRAEGSHSEGHSEAFGSTQSSNHSRIILIRAQSMKGILYKGETGLKYFDINEGQWTERIVEKDVLSNLLLFTSKAENRPRNTAIRIWIRIQ